MKKKTIVVSLNHIVKISKRLRNQRQETSKSSSSSSQSQSQQQFKPSITPTSTASSSRAYNYIPVAKSALTNTLVTSSASPSPSSTPSLVLKQSSKHYKSNFNNILETDDELNANDNDYSTETRSLAKSNALLGDDYAVANDDDDDERTRKLKSTIISSHPHNLSSIRRPVVSLSNLKLEHRFYQNKREPKNYRKYILNDNIQKLLKKYSVY